MEDSEYSKPPGSASKGKKADREVGLLATCFSYWIPIDGGLHYVRDQTDRLLSFSSIQPGLQHSISKKSRPQDQHVLAHVQTRLRLRRGQSIGYSISQHCGLMSSVSFGIPGTLQII